MMPVAAALFVPVFGIAAAVALHAQSPAPAAQDPVFDVVSIKVNTSADGRISIRSRPDGGFSMTNGTLQLLLGQTFPGSTQDIVGMPDWAASARFDVNATAPPGIGTATPEQRRAMMRAMLADRFKLTTHYETREQPAFDLVLARSDGKLGPQLTPSDIDCAARAAAQRAATEAARAAGQPPPPPTPAVPFSPTAPLPPCSMRSIGTRFDGHMTMASLAQALRSMSGRVVVDKTGLGGYFNVRIDSASTAPGLVPSADAVDLPSIFTAVQEQLGLKLESSRTQIQVMVIDRIERPTEN
jgi:uncharacterized protein (TIGR03435 family)